MPPGGRPPAARQSRFRGGKLGRAHGFTLVEVLTACTVAALLAAIALPSFRAPLLHSHRTDGVAVLMRLQAAQDRLRHNSGIY